MKARLKQVARPARQAVRREIASAVADAVAQPQSNIEHEVKDLRRLIADDMDASNEAAAVFGRVLARLEDGLADVAARQQELGAAVDQLKASVEAMRRGS